MNVCVRVSIITTSSKCKFLKCIGHLCESGTVNQYIIRKIVKRPKIKVRRSKKSHKRA